MNHSEWVNQSVIFRGSTKLFLKSLREVLFNTPIARKLQIKVRN